MPEVRLVDRRPALGADELVSRLLPPRRFAGTRFATYRPNPAHPSQQAALDEVERFAEVVCRKAEDTGGRRFLKRRNRPTAVHDTDSRPARYLDGGFGVGKTHLLASLWFEAPDPKAYLTFAELTALIGFLGMERAVEAFSTYRLVCIDEFELDDVANTLMTVTFLRSVVPGGTRVAATSNTLPDKLGEGRFGAADFQREIAAIASHFDVLRIDGPDYRAASRHSAEPLAGTAAALDAAHLMSGSGRVVSIDEFGALLAHLRHVHPVQVGALLDGLDAVVVHGLGPITNQGDALLWVHFVDEAYDAGLTVVASGVPIGALFDPSFRNGGYRKKYGRCESRMAALCGEAAGTLAASSG